MVDHRLALVVHSVVGERRWPQVIIDFEPGVSDRNPGPTSRRPPDVLIQFWHPDDADRAAEALRKLRDNGARVYPQVRTRTVDIVAFNARVWVRLVAVWRRPDGT